VPAKDRDRTSKTGASKPLLLVDIDGVVSLFGPSQALGGPGARRPDDALAGDAPPAVEGSFHSIDGIPHFLSSTAAAHLQDLSETFELVWASGWEEKANEYLPRLLGLPAPLPFIRFTARENANGTGHAHWKLSSIATYARDRSLAWIDDAFNPACHDWAAARPAPTLLVATVPERGLTGSEAQSLREWARRLALTE
jgi:HAD domain in Swiss Army Knife RNA repair proteins